MIHDRRPSSMISTLGYTPNFYTTRRTRAVHCIHTSKIVNPWKNTSQLWLKSIQDAADVNSDCEKCRQRYAGGASPLSLSCPATRRSNSSLRYSRVSNGLPGWTREGSWCESVLSRVGLVVMIVSGSDVPDGDSDAKDEACEGMRVSSLLGEEGGDVKGDDVRLSSSSCLGDA